MTTRMSPEREAAIREEAAQGLYAGKRRDSEILAELDAVRGELEREREKVAHLARSHGWSELMNCTPLAYLASALAERDAATAALSTLVEAAAGMEEPLRRLDCHIDGMEFVVDPDHPERGAVEALFAAGERLLVARTLTKNRSGSGEKNALAEHEVQNPLVTNRKDK
jgi:hypothetical protein